MSIVLRLVLTICVDLFHHALDVCERHPAADRAHDVLDFLHRDRAVVVAIKQRKHLLAFYKQATLIRVIHG